MKEHFSSRVTKLLVILALAIVASVMFVFVGCGEQHVHTWTQTNEQAATCTADGFIEYTCEECGDVRQEPVQATGHQWKDNGALQTHPATCTESGYYYKLCTVCNYEETSDRIPATGHTLDFADATINAPTCTADGSLTGTCANGCGETVTINADDIDLGKNVIGYTDEVAQDKEDAANEAAEEGEEVDYNIGYADKEETVSTFLQKLNHAYQYGNEVCEKQFNGADKEHFGENATDKNTWYYDYCERCHTAFETKAHTMPKGTIACKSISENKDYKGAQPVTASADDIAYVCEVCEAEVPVADHSIVAMEKTGVDEFGVAIYKPLPEGTEIDCSNYGVCEYCYKLEVSMAHTYPTAADTEHYINCAHGNICTVCGQELDQPIAHNWNTAQAGTDGKFGTHTGNTEATCTTAGYTYRYCTMCKAREEAGEEVEWVLAETPEPGVKVDATGNYAVVGYEPASHTWNDVRVPIKVQNNDTSIVNCVTGWNVTYVCDDCGTKRVEVRPELYSDKDLTKKVAADTKLDAETKYFYSEDGKTVEILGKDFKWNTAADGIEWTDENGYMASQKVAPGEHSLKLVPVENYTAAQYKKYSKPNCISGGSVLYVCTECDTEVWKEKSGEDGKGAVEKDPNNHASKEMLACGENYCVECATGNHNMQYTITLKFQLPEGVTDVTAPASVVYNVYACWPETTKNGGITEKDIRDYFKLDSDVNFTYIFGEMKDTKNDVVLTAWSEIGAVASGEPSYNGNVDITVTAQPKTQYTIKFVSVGSDEDDYDSDKIIAENANIFDERAVYVADKDKSQAAPVVNGYSIRFYVMVNGEQTNFSFASFDFNDFESKDGVKTVDGVQLDAGDVLTIYVWARAYNN